MTSTQTIADIPALCQAIEDARSRDHPRTLIAIVGAPGSGKSTLSAALANTINAAHPGSCAIVPMDGFHLDDSVLSAQGLRARKGAPETFDVAGFVNLHQRLRNEADGDIAVALFDRTMELSRAAAAIIAPKVRTVLVEGNYLLLQSRGWEQLSSFYDLTIMIDVPATELKSRLLQRWDEHGFSPEDATTKVEANDMINVRTVLEKSASADILYRQV